MVKAYICATAFDHEIEHVKTELYPSKEDLLKARPSCEDCAIYEVDVVFVRKVKDWSYMDYKQ